MSQEKENSSDDRQAKNGIFGETYPYKSASEYAVAVNQWLWQCYHWQCFSLAYPYYFGLASSNASVNTGSGAPDLNRNLPNSYIPNQNVFSPRGAFGVHSRPGELQGGDFTIPPLWKRFAAEVIDFFILLVLKVMITYIAVDFFDLINLDKYDFDLLRNDKMDYHKAMEVTSEIITLEIIHRFVVCIFETCMRFPGHQGPLTSIPSSTCGMQLREVFLASTTFHLIFINCEITYGFLRYPVCSPSQEESRPSSKGKMVQRATRQATCLHKGILGAGGATPGKSVMKLKVVSCHGAVPIDHNRVRVYPAGDLGFWWALLRAFIKNFSLAFIFPICFTMFFFQHNRTAYDIICNSIVVEDNLQRVRRN